MSFLMLRIASRALAAQQLAMDVTGQNLANVTTPGYRREQTILTEANPVPMGGFNAANGPSQLGQGVTVETVTRVNDAFLSRSVRSQTSLSGTWSAINQALQQLQPFFSEPSSSGLSESMTAFFGAWQTVSQNPTSLSARTALLGQAQQLAGTFHSLNQQLLTEQTNLNQSVVDQVGQINSLATQIANLNKSIQNVSSSGQPPNDLLDQRGQLLTQLSQLVNITYTQNSSGAVDIYLGAHPLVVGRQTYQLTTAIDPVSGFNQVQFTDGSVATVQSGTLYGTLSVRGQTQNGVVTGYIPTYLSQLNALAAGLAQAVNTQHAQGVSLDTATNTNPAYANVFTFGNTTAGAGSITVNPNLLQDPAAIRAASQTGGTGDGSNALAIAKIQQENVITYPGQANTTTLQDYYQSLIGQLGLDGQTAAGRSQSANSTLNDLQQALHSKVGVNPDQSSVSLIQEEQSYKAAAKVVLTEQSVMNALLAAVS